MDVRGLPVLSPIGEFRRPREPEELSGITYVEGDRYYAVCDDGSGIWPMEIGIDRASGMVTNCVIGGNVRTGGDNEGIAWNPRRSTVFVTDEKTPTIHEIDPATGSHVAEVPLPEHQRKARKNRGLEALALSPDGEFLWTANEEALPGDGERSSEREGTTVRLTRFRHDGAGWARDGEWAYLTDAIGGGKTRRMRSENVSSSVRIHSYCRIGSPASSDSSFALSIFLPRANPSYFFQYTTSRILSQ